MGSCQYSLVFPLTAQGKQPEHAECFMGQSRQCRRPQKAFKGNFPPTKSGGLFRALRPQAWELKTRKVNSMSSSKGMTEHKDF